MIFQSLFESVQSTHYFPPIFLLNDHSTIEGLQYNSVTRSYCTASQANGYHVCSSKLSNAILGTNTFNCTKGGYILYQCVCNGHFDCPNDNSDEEYCQCYNNYTYQTKSFHCKYLYSNHSKLTCSPLYFSTFKGDCKMYTNIEYKQNGIKVSGQKSGKIKCNNGKNIHTSFMNDLIPNCEHGEVELELDAILRKETHFSCRYLQELPCLKGHSRCFITDLPL